MKDECKLFIVVFYVGVSYKGFN